VSFNKGGRKGFDARLITPKQQEELTKFFVSAFLEASLFNKTELFELVKHPQVQPGWPEDIYISRYLESNFNVIEDFEKGKNNTSIFKKSGNKLIKVSDEKIVAERLRGGTEIENKVLEINLSLVNSEIHVIVRLPKSFIPNLNKNKQIRFFFSLARASANKAGDCEPYNLLNDAKLSLLHGSNVLISKPLGKVGSVAPLLLSDYRPLESNENFRNPQTEPVLQTFEVPVDSGAWIQNLNDDTDSLMLDLTFSPSREQKIIIDDIGFVEQ